MNRHPPSLFAPASVDNRPVNSTDSMDSRWGVGNLTPMPLPRNTRRRLSHGQTVNPRLSSMAPADIARQVSSQILAREDAACALADLARSALPRVLDYALGLLPAGDSLAETSVDLVSDACGSPTRRGDAVAVVLDAARARMALDRGAARLTAREVAALSGRSRPTIVQSLGNRIHREAALAYIALSPSSLAPWGAANVSDVLPPVEGASDALPGLPVATAGQEGVVDELSL